ALPIYQGQRLLVADDVAAGLIDQAQSLLHRFLQASPRLGQEHAAVAPLEQAQAQLLFQAAYGPADGVVGQVEAVGGQAEALQLGGLLEIAQSHQRAGLETFETFFLGGRVVHASPALSKAPSRLSSRGRQAAAILRPFARLSAPSAPERPQSVHIGAAQGRHVLLKALQGPVPPAHPQQALDLRGGNVAHARTAEARKTSARPCAGTPQTGCVYSPRSVRPGWSSGRRPSGQWNLRSDSAMARSL